MNVVFTKIKCLIFFLVVVSISSFAQQNIFKTAPSDTQEVTPVESSIEVPINLTQLQTKLSEAPMENTKALPLVMNLPWYDGSKKSFQVWESPMMSADFAALRPEFKSYKIQSIDDIEISGRLAYTPFGISLIVFGKDDIYTIEPVNFPNGKMHRISKGLSHDHDHEPGETCGVIDKNFETEKQDLGYIFAGNKMITLTNGADKRTFNFAAVCTGEWHDDNGGTVASAQAAVVFQVNVLNGIYERDLGYTFNLLTPFVYTSPTTDPFDASASNRTRQAAAAVAMNFTNSASYDIGHVFHGTTGGGSGVASAGVCSNTVLTQPANFPPPAAPFTTGGFQKGRGWTGISNGMSVSLGVRITAHEVGHQFSASHTFNGDGSNCSGGNFSNANSYEIGSGTTIMSYKGICGTGQNIPSTTLDDYFHIRTLEQIVDFVATSATCATVMTGVNNPPVTDASPGCTGPFTIPVSTPFILSGSATDADGDNLTYCWEQFDEDASGATQGFIGAAAAGSTVAPLFRSFPPTSSPERTFPNIQDVINGNYQTDFEPLPTVARTLNFQLTTRDNNPNAGGFSTDNVAVTVNASGPFSVMGPNGGETLTAGNSTTITWTNNTSAFCTNVDVELSIDGGFNYPYVLAANTTNDGSVSITLPAVIPNSENAIIRVICADNPCVRFFDISDGVFSINSSCEAPTTEVSPTTGMTLPLGDPMLANLGMMNNLGSIVTNFSGTIENTDLSSTLIFSDGTPAMCTNGGNTTFYDTYTFSPDMTGSHTFTHTGPFGLVLNLYEAPSTGTGCTNHLASSATRPTGTGTITLNSSVTETLTAGQTYVLVVSSFSPTFPTLPAAYTINFTTPAGGNIFDGVILPTDYSYTYFALNTVTGLVAAVSATSDFSSLPGGTYQIYGAAYYSGAGPNPPTVTPSTWVGMTLNAILAGGCNVFSTNFKPLEITSTACALTSSGLGTIMCDDNGTATNASDDFITFTLNPMGSNLGTGYTVSVSGGTITPTMGVYGIVTNFQLQNGSAGAGNVTVTITDDATGGCTIMQLITDPGNCSASCELTASGLGTILCDDNGTNSNPSDDFLTFSLNPTGSNLGSGYTVSVSGGTISPTSGTYGSATNFQLQSGSAGAGNVTVTITDNASGGCTIMQLITDPGSCSTTCELTASGLGTIMCNDNGTNTNPSDDFLTFSLNPTGNNLGTNYTVSVSGGTISPTMGTYGSATNFQLQSGSAGLGNVTVTITDNTSGGCTIMQLITDPGSCSSTCELTASELSMIMCNDNGTNSDPSDDFITFSLNPSGSNLGSGYTVSVSGGTISPTSGTYGSATNFQLQAGSAGAGNVTITITDNASGGCTIMQLITDPGSCSTTCELTASGLGTILCDDNGTNTNASDDFLTFSLNPTGNNLGTNYTVSVSGGTISPTMGTYGSATNFQLQSGSAGAGNVTVTITDNTSGGCTIMQLITDPGSCSTNCELTASGLGTILCDDNGTNSNPSDDFLTFSLNPTGSNLGSGYTVSVSGGTISPTMGTYGSATNFQLQSGSAGAGNVTVTITDNASGGCTIMQLITDPGSCSTTCELTASGLGTIMCNDNGTNTNASDDFLTFSLNPTGNNLGTNYTLSVSGGTISPTMGTYGSATNFQLQSGSAGAGNVTVTITDNTSGGCTIMQLITDPGSCSTNCELTASGLGTILCDDNGTNSNPSDDFLTFSLNPTGSNLGSGYTVSVSGGTVSPTMGTYGSATNFQLQSGSAGAGNVTVTITDNASGGCTIMQLITDPGSCSTTCELTSGGLTNIMCNDNGTNTISTDDFLTFSLNPTGNNLGSGYTVSVSGGTISPTSGTYGAGTNFQLQNGSAGGGNVTVTITDNASGGCTEMVLITDPGSCSTTCDITSNGLANIMCNDGGTNSDPSDDFISFDLNVMGLNLGTGYTVSVSGGTISPTTGSYNTTESFQLQSGSAGAGNVTVTITDNASGACTEMVVITDPGSCSTTCELTSGGLTNIMCNDNGTNTISTDDFLTFSLNPTGNNLGTGYTVSVSSGTISPTSGTYGSGTNFQLQNGSAGGGNVTVTITDNASGGCTEMVVITDPGSCSTTCDITSNGLANIMCNDGGTNSDPSDDFISFDLNVMGLNLGTGYTVSVSGGTISPTTGSYNTTESFQLQSGSAGAGNVTVTITDNASGACTEMVVITDPGSCSTTCELTSGGLTNIMCNDNGTNTISTDDFLTFSLNPTGNNLGTGYTVSVSGGTISPTSGTYGAGTNFQLQNGSAGGGNVTVTITDNASGGCTEMVVITDPGSCSTTCDITSNGLANIMCNDGGTNSDPSDDFISFDLNVMGLNLGTGYTVSVSGGTISPTTGSYNTTESFQLQSGSAGSGNVTVTITDNASGVCTEVVAITDPGSCSTTCNLATSGLGTISCNDNGTNTIGSDDFLTFSLNPTGMNLGTGYTVSVSGGTISPTMGTYGSATIFQLQNGSAGGGNVTVTITDNASGGCTIMQLITDPGSCSPVCELLMANLTNVQCNDNGTPTIPSDDFITFDLNPTGNNLATTYTVSGATLTSSTGTYGMVSSFSTPSGSAGTGNLNLTITDDADGACTITATVTDPGTCSTTCGLVNAGLSNIQCNDNGTPLNPFDDFYSFDLNPTGNNLGTTYTVSGATTTPTMGTYGTTTSFTSQPGTAGFGNLNLIITDGTSGGCTLNVTVTDPGFCSGIPASLSQVDIDGDGMPDIVDPCSCSDPQNMEVNGTLYFHDFVTIVSNPGESWSITNVTVGNLYILPLPTSIGAGTTIPEVSPGVYRIDFWTEAGVGFAAGFNRATNPLLAPLMTGGTCDDNTIPTAICQDVTIQLDADGMATLNPAQVNNGSNDDCSSLSFSLDQTDFTCADLGTNTVNLTVTDLGGNSDNCSATVTVEDNIDPTIVCNNILINLDPGACDAVISWNDPVATDNCGIASVTQTSGPTSGSTFDGNTTTTISYIATDNSGNTVNCSFNVVVTEYVPSSNVITCNSMVNISLDGNCQAIVSADQILEGGDYGCYDDYPVTFADGPNEGQPVILGPGNIGQTINVMVTNPSGNPCWGQILVEDKLIPNLVCTDVTVGCAESTDPGASIAATIDYTLPTVTSIDNNTVTETITITNGDEIQDLDVAISTNHTWIGDVDMTITSPSGTVVTLFDRPGVPATPFGCNNTTDMNFSFDDDAVKTATDLENDCPPDGAYQPVDPLATFNGEPAQGTWTIAITDSAAPDAGDFDITLNLKSANSGTVEYPVPAGTTILPASNNTFTVIGFDPCGPATLTYIDVEGGDLCAGTQTITRNWSVEDGSGNTSTCTQTISITPATLDAITLPSDVTLECGQDYTDPNLVGMPTGNGCANIDFTHSGDVVIDICGNGVKVLRTYIVSDWCTNTTIEHIQIIKVEDTTAPTLTCPADLTINTTSSSCEGNVALIMPTSTDCGGGVTYEVTSTAGTVSGNLLVGLPVGIHTVTFTGTDDCGNSAVCTQKITVEDNVSPTAVCDEHTVISLGSDGTAWVAATSFDDGSNDNCGIVSMLAQRMDNPNCPGFDGTSLDTHVPFSCCDVGTYSNDCIPSNGCCRQYEYMYGRS